MLRWARRDGLRLAYPVSICNDHRRLARGANIGDAVRLFPSRSKHGLSGALVLYLRLEQVQGCTTSPPSWLRRAGLRSPVGSPDGRTSPARSP